jgi:hypothetical protein
LKSSPAGIPAKGGSAARRPNEWLVFQRARADFSAMCAALEVNTRLLRPGRIVRAWRKDQILAALVWAGFARKESLGWWKKKVGELVDVPAHRFAERSDRDRQLRWDDIHAGLIVRGVVDPNDGKPLLKIVTRASTPEELTRFEHPRMPLLEPPLFSAEIPPDEPAPDTAQAELF